MKVTLNWLKQYVDFNWSPEELAERLTMLGLEVESVHKVAGEFDGIVVAQVLTCDKHPNADKLSVCRVNDGAGERQIVCGAQNFKAGDKVPLILPGASLPPKVGETQPFTIKVGKIRNVESHGMMCSHEELSLDPEAIGHKKEDGLLLLREDAKVGQSFAEYLGRTGGDVVYDLEITPNRPDWNSVIGIAREISASTGNALKVPEFKIQNSQLKIEDLISVRLDAPDLCPRYTARVIRGVKISPSPEWLRSALEKVGLRSINNVVDVTNFVMMEVGQPLHAFDYHLVAKSADGKPTIVVRRALPGEEFITLDGKNQTLNAEHLLIADEAKAIALAGVMGGQNTGINEQTVDVLLESACFAPTNIRRTSKHLGLRTDSSYRFERGADVGICDWASQRAAQLILETAGGHLADGVVDAYPNPAETKEISLRHTQVETLLGIAIPLPDQRRFLLSLGLQRSSMHVPFVDASSDTATLMNKPLIADSHAGVTTFRIPTWRVDLKREVDLIEEIARLYGVDKIPSTAPRGAHGENAFDATYDRISDVRQLLAGLGLNEATGQTLVGKDEVRSMKDEAVIALANPLSSDMDVLRPSLLPGLLNSLRHNSARKNQDVALFEIGRVFNNVNGQTKEERRVAIAITGQRAPTFWGGDDHEAKFDAMDLKGIVEDLLEHFSLRGIQFTKRTESTALFLESAGIALGGKQQLGELGQLLPALAKKYDLRDAVFLAELRLDELITRGNPAKSFKPLPQFPASRRDVAMLVPEATTHDAVLLAIKQAKPANLESVELFDVFRGKNVPEGQKSLAYAFTYRGSDKTLTDVEISASHTKVVESFKTQLQATLRE